MFGKPSWFQRRKYGGWGLYPKTWQGWLYVGLAVIIVMFIQFLPFGAQEKTIATLLITGVLIIDVIHIMTRMPMDERDRIHEAIAERNALWIMVTALAAGACWQAYASAPDGTIIDPVIIIALIAGLIAKAATNIYLDKKN